MGIENNSKKIIYKRRHFILYEINFNKLMCFANCNNLIYNANDVMEEKYWLKGKGEHTNGSRSD